MPTVPESAVHKYQFVISADVIDRNGHVNNVAYVQWMQDAAVNHSKSVLPNGAYRDAGSTWVARSHHIEYLSPAFAAETIEVRTWLAECRRVRCKRKYVFMRTSDQKLIAQGETDWVFVNAEDGRPKSIPPEISNAFLSLEDHDNTE